ncbi:hypothetical protein JJD41_17665 [Oxynema sp. CENA135]|nr:hypothetical protein [Oxynema sp. CENA135]
MTSIYWWIYGADSPTSWHRGDRPRKSRNLLPTPSISPRCLPRVKMERRRSVGGNGRSHLNSF